MSLFSFVEGITVNAPVATPVIHFDSTIDGFVIDFNPDSNNESDSNELDGIINHQCTTGGGCNTSGSL